MPCHVRSASVPKKRRRLSLRLSPPRILAMLDLSKQPERDTRAFLKRACSGRWPMWRMLSMRRQDLTLYAAVEWLRPSRDDPFALVELALDRLALCWRYFPTAAPALAELAKIEQPPVGELHAGEG
jgi:hypothetical protein